MLVRIAILLFLALSLGFLFLQGRLIDRSFELPVFMKTDTIAMSHRTGIRISVPFKAGPDMTEITVLEKDYSAIWAHLNHLFSTNDVKAGKEYYTESWYKLICQTNPPSLPQRVKRKDLDHSVEILTWSSDGLVCTLADKQACFEYRFEGKKKDSLLYIHTNLVMSLLYEGDHWRLDGLRIVKEEPVGSGKNHISQHHSIIQ